MVQQTMKWHSRLWRSALLSGLAALAWLAWQSPQPAWQPPVVRAHLPVMPVADHLAVAHKVAPLTTVSAKKRQTGGVEASQLWRVVTHRVISPEGIHALVKRLAAMQLHPIRIQSTEEMTMHAFDDAHLFKTRRQAREAARYWQQHDVETNIIRAAKGVYLLGLGRYFQAKYAEALQKQLDRVGRKYRYQRRRVPIPVVRFTFPASDRRQAEQLWKRLDVTGVVMPVLMAESQFDKLYGDQLYGDKLQQPQ